MNKIGTLLFAGWLALTLVGCGARSDEVGDLEPSSGAAAGELSVLVQSSPSQFVTGEDTPVTITAYIVDLDNRAVAGRTVRFSSSAGILQNVSAETDSEGAATASLSLVDDYRLQDVTVTVDAGGFIAQTDVPVVGTAFQVSGPSKIVTGNAAELDIMLVTGTGTAIAGERVTFESSAGATLMPSEAVTDADGRVSVSMASGTADETIIMRALENTIEARHDIEVLPEGSEPEPGAATDGTLDVRVQSSPQRLLTGGADAAVITAYVVDLNNRAIANETVSFSASAGVLQNVATETDANGVASATLALLDDYRTQDITVTVAAGTFEGSAIVRTDGSAFTVNGPGKVVAGAVAELDVTLTTGSGTPIAGETVTLESLAGNTITPAQAITDADGRVEIRVDSAAGSDSIELRALDGTVTTSHDIAVLTDSLTFDTLEAGQRFLVGTDSPVAVTWTHLGQPVADRELSFSTSTGRVIGASTVTTDADGRASVMLTSDLAGTTTITVEDAADGEPSATIDAEFVPALDVRVLSDANRIETGGSDVANITALVTDVDNKAVAGQTVGFSATGGVLQGVSAQTDENGVAGATLKLLQDFRTQDIVVTVTAGEFSGEVTISADGSELEVTGPANLVEGASAELVVVLTAGNGEPIVNEPVTIESVAGNAISPAEAITDVDGRIDVQVSSTNGDDTIRILALDDTVTASHSFTVSTDSLAFEALDADTEFEVGQEHDIAVTWSSQGLPVEGRTLRFAITAGQIVGPSMIATDAAGRATITVRSSSAGTARITVEDAADGEPSTYVDVEFVATAPAAVSVDASSTRVPTRGTSTITARVTDINGNPVKGREIVFGSADLKGGQLNPASATSGSDGEASVTFTAGSNATDVDEVVIRTEVEGMSIVDTLTLTVVERVLNVTIGTSNKVDGDNAFGTQYAVPFVVQVADGGGTPLENADVSLSIRPLAFGQGFMTLVDDKGQEQSDPVDPDWTPDHWEMWSKSISCAAEDSNGNRLLDGGEDLNDNGVLDPGEDTNGDGVLEPSEDINGNGTLDPQDPASLAAVEDPGYATLVGGSLTTDSTGSGYFRMIYPASNSRWAYVEITARAKALGAEAEDSFRISLLLPASEVEDPDVAPANYRSPYGTSLDCTKDY